MPLKFAFLRQNKMNPADLIVDVLGSMTLADRAVEEFKCVNPEYFETFPGVTHPLMRYLFNNFITAELHREIKGYVKEDRLDIAREQVRERIF